MHTPPHFLIVASVSVPHISGQEFGEQGVGQGINPRWIDYSKSTYKPPNQGYNPLSGVRSTELEDIDEYLSIPDQYTGGGGFAGELAKRLYYPSTTGGFSSAGSGITGAGTSSGIAELLKQLQG